MKINTSYALIVIIDEFTRCCEIVIINSTGKASDDGQQVKLKFGLYNLTGSLKNGKSVYQHLGTKSGFLFFEDIWMVSIIFRITLEIKKRAYSYNTQTLLIT